MGNAALPSTCTQLSAIRAPQKTSSGCVWQQRQSPNALQQQHEWCTEPMLQVPVIGLLSPPGKTCPKIAWRYPIVLCCTDAIPDADDGMMLTKVCKVCKPEYTYDSCCSPLRKIGDLLIMVRQ